MEQLPSSSHYTGVMVDEISRGLLLPSKEAIAEMERGHNKLIKHL